MLDKIAASQLSCYLNEVPWETVEKFAQEFMGKIAKIEEHTDHSLILSHEQGRLQIDRFALQPELLPWSYLISLTLFRDESPYDSWLTVQLAREWAIATQKPAFCEPPLELGMFSSVYYWQLGLYPVQKRVSCQLLKYDEIDIEHMEEVATVQINLNEFPLFTTPLPYFSQGYSPSSTK